MVETTELRNEKSVHFPATPSITLANESDPAAAKPSVPGMLRRASMAVFSGTEATPKERKKSVQRSMSVFVDDEEVFGLPPLSPSIPSPRTAASALVESVRDGSYGLITKRSGTGFKEHYDSAKNLKPRDEEEGGIGTFNEKNIEDDEDDDDSSFSASSEGISGGAGLLSTLLALSSQKSAPNPASSSVKSFGSSSSGASYKEDSGSEDEEVAKLKFTEIQRTKREKSVMREFARSGKVAKVMATKAVAVAFEATFDRSNAPSSLVLAKGFLGRESSGSLAALNQSIGSGHSCLVSTSLKQQKPGTKIKKLSDKLGLDDSKNKLMAKFGIIPETYNTPTPYNESSPGYHLHHYDTPTDHYSMCPLTACAAEKVQDFDAKTLVPELPVYTLKKGQVGPPSIYTFGFPNPNGDIPTFFIDKNETTLERENREWEKEKVRRQRKIEKKLQEQVFIVAHVAAILSRQEFILKLGRAFMMFGAPSHRLESQLQATARVLEIDCQVVYLPGIMLVSFGDAATHTSEIKFLKQANGLHLGNLTAVYQVYGNVIHDRVSVVEASVALDKLMTAAPKFNLWQQCILGGLASALIQTSSFNGSFIDSVAAFPLGALIVFVRVQVSKNDLYSSLFEIVMACFCSFVSAALASTGQLCFAAVASGAVVGILPGYIVLCGSLELANRSIISGSVRLVYSVLYALFLGFGLSMGGEIWQTVSGRGIVGGSDYTCSAIRMGDVPWWRAAPPTWVYILTVPTYLLITTQRNQQPFRRISTLVMIIFASAGFVASFYATRAFPGRPDISAAVGAFSVGLLGNLYGKIVKGSQPFIMMLIGVMFQLPSGLSNGGLLNFATTVHGDYATTAYSSAGFNTASSLISVSVGITVGLFTSAAVVNSIGGGRRRGTNLSSF